MLAGIVGALLAGIVGLLASWLITRASGMRPVMAMLIAAAVVLALMIGVAILFVIASG